MTVARFEQHLVDIEDELDSLPKTRRESMEWIAKLSERLSQLDAFRTEVRTSFEPW